MQGAVTRTPHQHRVDEFMRRAGQELPDRPTLPDERTRLLRARLILEEALETVSALGFGVVQQGRDLTDKEQFKESVTFVPRFRGEDVNVNAALAGIADGCADIIVVTTGTLSACGISDDPVQREVDLNNLAKFEHRCPGCGLSIKPNSMSVSEETGRAPGERRCLCCGMVWRSGYRDQHGKWVKPEGHKPPEIARVLAWQAAGRPSCFGSRFTPADARCWGCTCMKDCLGSYEQWAER